MGGIHCKCGITKPCIEQQKPLLSHLPLHRSNLIPDTDLLVTPVVDLDDGVDPFRSGGKEVAVQLFGDGEEFGRGARNGRAHVVEAVVQAALVENRFQLGDCTAETFRSAVLGNDRDIHERHDRAVCTPVGVINGKRFLHGRVRPKYN